MTKEKFEDAYDRLANRLLLYVNQRVREKELSESIVQEIFTTLWQRKDDLEIESIDSYLFSAAKFQILKHFRSLNVQKKYLEHFSLFLAQHQEANFEAELNASELKKLISSALKPLPHNCQQIFIRSRFDYRSIQEIALEFNLSTRTVENYISMALRHLRKELAHYPLAILLISNFFY